MQQYKKAQVIMLPTQDNDSSLAICSIKGFPNSPIKNGELCSKNTKGWSNAWRPQHLYFISDDEIIYTCWVYNSKEKIVEQIRSKENLEFIIEHNSFDKIFFKVIATTDKSLTFDCKINKNKFYYLPQPSKEWIEYYISEYNKGNVITNVLVEYFYSSGGFSHINNIKINPDNTINIKSAKENWNREEVKRLMLGSIVKYSTSVDLIEARSWIELNL